MSDIVKSMKEAVCLPDTGCMSVVTCICDIMQDAADEIERLRNLVDQCDHHEHSLQEAQRSITQLRGKLETQLEAYTRLAAENRKLRIDGGWNLD